MRPSPPAVLHHRPAALPRGATGWKACAVRRWFTVLFALVLVAWIASAPGSAAAFGTIDSGGQHREHEHITRAALACVGDAGAEPDCFEPESIDYLAGHDREFGAVGAPDNDELSDPAAHCDNADFVEGDYPRTRDQATDSLVDCVNHLRARWKEGVDSAKGLLDDEGQVIVGEVTLNRSAIRMNARKTAPSVRPSRGSGECSMALRTSTRTATGPTRRTRPGPLGTRIRRV